MCRVKEPNHTFVFRFRLETEVVGVGKGAELYVSLHKSLSRV